MINIDVDLQAKQLEALKALNESSVVLYGGAKGGGKSWLVRFWQVMRRLKYPNTHGTIIRKTYGDLYDNHIKKFFEEYPELMKNYKSTDKILFFPNGSTLSFRYLDRESDLRNFQGAEYEDIVVDEITQHVEDVFKVLRSSNRTTKKGIKPKMFLTGNPGDIGHAWVKRIFVDRKFNPGEDPNDFAFIKAKVYDNKKLMEADPSYVDRLKALPEKVRRAYLDGDWNVFSGQYFTEWFPELHVVSPFEIPKDWARFRAIDWGFRPDPAVCGWYAVNPTGKTYKYREIEVNEMLPVEFANYIKRLSVYPDGQSEEIQYTVIDPSTFKHDSGESIAEQMYNKGQGIVLREADNTRVAGWTRLRAYLQFKRDDAGQVISEPILQVFSNCIHTIQHFPEMVHDERNPEDIKGKGLYDHQMDETRYFVMSRPLPTEVSVQSLKPTTLVNKAILDFKRAAKRRTESDSYIDDVYGF